MNRRIVWFAVLLLVLAACSKAAPATSGGGGGAEGGSSAGGSSAGGSSGPLTVEGSLTTSGAYEATWTWKPGNDVGFGDSITLTSDKGTFANIQVPRDGTISFGSGVVSEIGLNATGAGAQVTLDGQNTVVCGFTVDADLAGAPGGALHLKGTLTIHGFDGFFSC